MEESDNGIVKVKSDHPYDDTCRRIELLIRARNFTVFADLDFARDAMKSGLVMRPARLFIFGNPMTGTPIMQSAPSAAIDLPLKVLVSQDAVGVVWVSYNSPRYLAKRHGIPESLLKNIMGIEALVEKGAGPAFLSG